MTPKMVMVLTVIHGSLLTGALFLRNSVAPPLSMCERGLSAAWRQGTKGNFEGALVQAQATESRMKQMYGAESFKASLASQVIAELHLKAGSPERSVKLYEELLKRQVVGPGGETGWLVDGQSKRPIREFRSRPHDWEDPWVIQLPPVKQGLAVAQKAWLAKQAEAAKAESEEQTS